MQDPGVGDDGEKETERERERGRLREERERQARDNGKHAKNDRKRKQA